MPPAALLAGTLSLAMVAGVAHATAAPSASPPASPLSAPISRVTVFSDRARVTRTATLPAGEGDRFELPLLGDRVDPDSLRIEVSGAELRRVEVSRVDGEDFPADEARALVEEIEALDDRIARTSAMQAVPRALGETLRTLAPTLPPADPTRPPPRLNPAGWAAASTFVDGWLERMQGRVRQEGERLSDLSRERARLADKARLLGGARRRSGHRVVVVLGGGPRGAKARLEATYMALAASWTPSYDIQLLPDGRRVQLAFAGMVSQQTGEDWDGAQLVLSTAVPATATVLPKLLTWKIGERDRFIPTASPVEEAVRPPPRAVPTLVERRKTAALQARLLQLAGQPPGDKADTDALRAAAEAAPEPAEYEQPADEFVPPPPPPAPAPMRKYPPRVPAVAQKSIESVEAVVASAPAGYPSSADRRPEAPPDQVGLAPPPGWTPPYYGPDLPVSLAGGLDLTFPSLRAETVRSGREARRVALLSEQWPVEVERRVFAALAPEAYVTAEIKNPSPTALPGGTANLSVGDDPAGTASLSLMASGETVTLPLGLDRAVKPVRNVKLVQSEKGVFSKDDVGEYTVTIEIANPYPSPLPLRVLDQLPLSNDKNVEIKAGPMEPAPVSQDKVSGALEWRVTVPVGGKSTLRFTYTIRRPKGWRLHQ